MQYREQELWIRELAQRVKEASTHTRYEIGRKKWAEHNDLLSTEPLLVYTDDDGAWLELVPESSLLCEDADLRSMEMSLRRLLYRHEHIADDYVLEPVLTFDIPGEYTGYHYGNARQVTAWGIPIHAQAAGKSAYHLEDSLQDAKNVQRLLEHEVDFIVDSRELSRKRQRAQEALSGSLQTQFVVPYSALVQSLLIELVHLRSLGELMYDLCDRPEWVRGILSHMAHSKAALLRRMEWDGLLYDNRTNAYTGSGDLLLEAQSSAVDWKTGRRVNCPGGTRGRRHETLRDRNHFNGSAHLRRQPKNH